MNTSPLEKIHTQVEVLNGSLKVSHLIVHKFFFYFNAITLDNISYEVRILSGGTRK